MDTSIGRPPMVRRFRFLTGMLRRRSTKPKMAAAKKRQAGARHFQKTFLTFCTALLLESIVLQLATQVQVDPTSGAVTLIASSQTDHHPASGQTVTVSSTQASEETPAPTPTPEPTATPEPRLFPGIVTPAVAAAPAGASHETVVLFHPPLRSYVISQYFSYRHQAVDMVANYGTPVYSSTIGKVAGTGYLIPGGGLMVKVDHPAGYTTYYAHLSAITASVGQQVDNSVQIGRIGATGWATGPHLHFMLAQNGSFLNPLNVMK